MPIVRFNQFLVLSREALIGSWALTAWHELHPCVYIAGQDPEFGVRFSGVTPCRAVRIRFQQAAGSL